MTARGVSASAIEHAISDWRAWPVGYGETLSRGLWTADPVHELMAAELMRTVMAPDDRRLIINVQPRIGKTEGIGHYGSTWYLDWWPHQRVVLAMYAAELAGEVGAKVRDTIRENTTALAVRVRRDSSARNRWNTTAGGGFVATGVGGILTGRGGGLLLCDDPIKNSEEANSQVMRDKVWEWWRSTFRTRLEPGPDGRDGAIVVVMTRWHEDDLTGRLLREQPGLWRQVVIPALAGDDDPLGRAPGQALTARYPVEQLEKTRSELGPLIFDAMYQQAPSAPEGTLLKRAWWMRYDRAPLAGAEQYLASIDCTFADTNDSDYVVIQVWARVGAKKYLLDAWRRQADFVTTLRAVRAMRARWPQVGEWIVESKANGPAVMSALGDEIVGLNGFRPLDSKSARAQACQPTLAGGQVYLPVAGTVFARLLPDDPWELAVSDFIDECAAFPNGTNDDQVDAFTQAMLHMGVSSPLLASTTYRDERLRGRR